MTKKPGISIVITAHNAADTIGECLESIAANRGFDPQDIEVILVDDRSRDNTAAVARTLGLDNLVIMSIEKYEDRSLTARQVALDTGFRKARGGIILVTDADAVVPSDWIRNMTRPLRSNASLYLAEISSPAAAAGMIEFRGEKNWLAKLQSVDSFCYFFLSCFFNRLGLSGGIFFGNFAFKKEVYEKIGGFKALGFALTEDLQFFRAIRADGFPVHFCKSAPISVHAAGTCKDLIQRIKRVSSGGFSLLSLGLGVWLVSFIILLILAAGTNPVILALLGIRYLLGAGFAVYAVLGVRRFSLLPLALVYELSVIALGIIALLAIRFKRKVEWGGVTYDR